ncbi:DedA family protein [Modestobacter marinus]|uniref:DedA family protein n=1 Tax=Modestobacter marinus TaxID=477641 RepID=UPI001C95656B|nr:DedA family protein [Modestobacter marinus]
MSDFVQQVADAVPGWAVLLGVFALPAVEASTLLGLVVPGEVAVLLGGVLAAQGRVGLPAVMGAAAAGAVVGDSVGYALGSRLGPGLRARVSARARHRLDRGLGVLRRRGGGAVLIGRWTAFLRAVIPAATGVSGYPYARFAVLNVTGGTVWAVAVAAIGFLTGSAYHQAERYLGLVGAACLLALVVGLLVGHAGHRHSRRPERPGPDPA